MVSQLWFFGKVFIVSGVIAIAIKQVSPVLPIAATPTNALIGVFTLPLVLLGSLLWRDQRRNNTSTDTH